MIRKTVELEATSAQGIEEAVELAVARASVTLEGLERVAVKHIGAHIEDGRIAGWDVTVDVTFQVRNGVHD